MQQAALAYAPTYTRPAAQPGIAPSIAARNSLSRAWDVLESASGLTPAAEAALAYLGFIFNGAVKTAIRDLRHYLPRRRERAAGETVRDALATLRMQIDRSSSFFFPLDETLDEDGLVREALAALQSALDASLDRNAQTATVREALRFLLWKSGAPWAYVNFWNSLAFHGGNGLWRSGQAALQSIRAALDAVEPKAGDFAFTYVPRAD